MPILVLRSTGYRHARRNYEDIEKAAQSSAHCPLLIDSVVAFGKSEIQEWPFAKILVWGKSYAG